MATSLTEKTATLGDVNLIGNAGNLYKSSVADGNKIPIQSEINTSLSTKSNTGHTHMIADVTNLLDTLNSKASAFHKQAYTANECGDYISNDGTMGITPSAVKKAFLIFAYPVGSVYLSIVGTSPASFLGGTWERLPEGYALWTASSGAGGTIGAGLPNITGYVSMRDLDDTNGNNDIQLTNNGAFQSSNFSWANRSGSGGSYCGKIVSFDASRSSSIYGNSSTVQPPAYKVYAWKRIE